MTWHQEQAAKRAHANRNKPAHIYKNSLSVYALCGEKSPTVTVDAEHAEKPENKTCKKCLKIHLKNS